MEVLKRAVTCLRLGALVALAACGEQSDIRREGPTYEPRDGGAVSLRDAAPVDGALTDAGALLRATDSAVAGDATAGTDAAQARDAGSDAAVPYVFAPDPVTLGLALPAVVPVLKVSVGGQTIQKDVNVAGQLQVFEDHDGTLTDLGGSAPTLETAIAFQGRGNFTWTLPKKGYAFELQDGAGNERDQPLLGMPPGSDFALYACFTDKTCLRNALVYALGQELGRWSPRARFVELFIDDVYQGLYMVWERIRRDPTRVALPKPAPTSAAGDLTGGYIVRHEGGGKGGGRDFTTASNIVYTYHYPDVAKLDPEQAQYIRGHFQAFETAMAADPTKYLEWIDEPSWVDRGIVEEVTNNWDGYVHSIYMTKDTDANGGLLGMGPLWDFDLAFANGNVTGYNCKTDNWAYQITRDYPDDVPFYWLALYANDAFKHAWKCRYQALRTGPLALATFEARIDAWKAFTAAARARDQAKWPTIGMSTFPNCTTQPSYDAELTYLHDFIAARLSWLDAQASAMPGTCP